MATNEQGMVTATEHKRSARILIAGCGDIGTRLGLRLAAAGDEVFGLRRDPARLPPAIRPLAADLASGTGLEALPGRLDAVVYAAAADGPGEAAYRAAYLDGLATLLARLHRAGMPRRLVFVSSTAVHAQDDGAWVDETSPAAPATPSARCLRETERLALAAPCEAVVVRPGGIYGPGRTRLIEQVRRGAPCTPGAWSNRIHAEDLARALAHLLALPAPELLYLAVDDAPVELCEVLDWIADQLGLPHPPRDPGTGGGHGSNKRCSNARLKASGFRFEYPSYREGYADMLKSAR